MTKSALLEYGACSCILDSLQSYIYFANFNVSNINFGKLLLRAN